MRLVTMRGDACRELSVRTTDDVRDAMQTMNQTGRTLLLVLDGDRFAGVVADGDIRRYLAKGGDADEPVGVAVNPTPITMPANSAPSEVRAFMARRGLEYLPLVHGDAVDALCVLERLPRASDMSAVVMAGGLGTRLAPLTDSCPKPLLPLGGKPILTHILDHLRSEGIHRFVFTVNYLSNMIVDHYDDGSRWDCFIDYVSETQRLGTGGALSLLDPQSLSDPFLCINGDVLNDLDVDALRDTHVSNGWDATMVVRRYSHTVPYGVVEIGPDGGFHGISEKPVSSYDVNAGIYMLSHAALAVVPRDQFYDLPDAFGDLAAAGLRCGTYVHSGRWIDIGTTSEYNRAQSIFDDTDSEPT